MKPSCPDCGAPVAWWWACHTWGGDADGKGWMACMECNSAIRYTCDEGCGWSYTHGLNPRNPRSVENEKSRPAWVNGRSSEWPVPGTYDFYDDKEWLGD